MDRRQRFCKPGRWVVKIGSALLTKDGLGLDVVAIQEWVQQIAALNQRGYEILLVSSGSIAEGCVRLGWQTRPTRVHELQAAASVGQMGLIQIYEQEFQNYDEQTAQILLTHDDLSNRKRYLNARSTLETLLELGVTPVINENDTVVTDEIRFGDNDTLAALVANLVGAEALVILTDQEGLYQSDPRLVPDAELVQEASSADDSLSAMATARSGALGRGGMATKVSAARRAARSGTDTLICSGRQSDILVRLAEGEGVGTLLFADTAPVTARKQWLEGHLNVKGSLVLDAGAVAVLKEEGKSLLPVGVIALKGEFKRGDLVSCVDEQNNEIARGLVNYGAADATKILRKASSEILDVLGYCDCEELIHRNNMTLMEV